MEVQRTLDESLWMDVRCDGWWLQQLTIVTASHAINGDATAGDYSARELHNDGERNDEHGEVIFCFFYLTCVWLW